MVSATSLQMFLLMTGFKNQRAGLFLFVHLDFLPSIPCLSCTLAEQDEEGSYYSQDEQEDENSAAGQRTGEYDSNGVSYRCSLLLSFHFLSLSLSFCPTASVCQTLHSQPALFNPRNGTSFTPSRSLRRFVGERACAFHRCVGLLSSRRQGSARAVWC